MHRRRVAKEVGSPLSGLDSPKRIAQALSRCRQPNDREFPNARSYRRQDLSNEPAQIEHCAILHVNLRHDLPTKDADLDERPQALRLLLRELS
jgi:hypothetical protein